MHLYNRNVVICGIQMVISVTYIVRSAHSCFQIAVMVNNCFAFFQVFVVNLSTTENCISLLLNSVYTTALFDKKVSLFNLYAIRVGLDNAATSRILVNPALIRIL